MAQIIDFNTRTSIPSHALQSQVSQPKSNFLDLSNINQNVLEALAEVSLREHLRCPAVVIEEFKRRADAYAATAKSYHDKFKATRSSQRLDKLLRKCMKHPTLIRDRIDHTLFNPDAEEPIHLEFKPSDYKSRQAQDAYSEIAHLAAEVVIDQRYEYEALHCDYMSRQCAQFAKHYADSNSAKLTTTGRDSIPNEREV